MTRYPRSRPGWQDGRDGVFLSEYALRPFPHATVRWLTRTLCDYRGGVSAAAAPGWRLPHLVKRTFFSGRREWWQP